MACEELGLDPITAALNGGEDYELLFTVPVADHARIKDNPTIRVIGHMTAPEEGMHLVSAGQLIELKAHGWRHV
jgi:thiamine-monophosphate kinase